MNKEKEKVKLACPKCKNNIEITLQHIVTWREAKCNRCSSQYKFGTMESSNLKTKMSNLDRAVNEFNKAYENLISKSDKVIKG